MSYLYDIVVWLLLFVNGIPYVLFLREYNQPHFDKSTPLPAYRGCLIGFSAWWLIAVVWVSPWILYRFAGNDIPTSVFYGFLTGSAIAIFVILDILSAQGLSDNR